MNKDSSISIREIIISFDDIDSINGGCTTHFVTEVIYKLYKKLRNIQLKDFPFLLRLNPDIPWKTRGNASILINLLVPNRISLSNIKKYIEKWLHSYISEEGASIGTTQPGIIIVEKKIIDRNLSIFKKLFREASVSSVNHSIFMEKFSLINKKEGIEYIAPYGLRGLIGALSSIGGAYQLEDYTFELLAYTKNPKNKLKSDETDIIYTILNEEDLTVYSNVDTSKMKLLITPHGPDPVAFGIRGNDPIELIRIYRKIRNYYNEIDKWMIFRTNQLTNYHIDNAKDVMMPYTQIEFILRYIGIDKILRNGHTIIKLKNAMTSKMNNCEMTGLLYYESVGMRKVIRKLQSNDYLLLNGNIRGKSDEHSINIERIIILKINEAIKNIKPICPKCHVYMESSGRNTGYKCRKCSYHIRSDFEELRIHINREYVSDVLLEPVRYQRHLTKTLKRYGREEIRKGELEKIAFKILLDDIVVHQIA